MVFDERQQKGESTALAKVRLRHANENFSKSHMTPLTVVVPEGTSDELDELIAQGWTELYRGPTTNHEEVRERMGGKK